MTHLELENEILQAFRGVTLDGGVSLLQAEVMDNYGEGVSHAQFLKLPRQEITDDWTAIPWQSLEEYGYLSYLDGKGYRYYIPAYLIGFLNGYGVDSVLSSLYPKKDNWDFHMELYSLLNPQQRAAIAHFLETLPRLLDLSREDRIVVERALRNFWDQYLSVNSSP